jgi:hypothetical protein
MIQQFPLVVDSVVLSSRVVVSYGETTTRPESAPTAPAKQNALARPLDFSPERVARMFDRRMPVVSNHWNWTLVIAWIAHPRSPFVQLALELNSMPQFTDEHGFVLMRILHEDIGLTTTMQQLWGIVAMAKSKRIVQ